ncbi:MAG: hypothetical protein ACE3L7_14380 [Candidatus Pristimantibacillus sp.]
MNFLFLATFTLGLIIIVLPIALSIKFKKRLRIPAARIKRKQYFEHLYEAAVKRDNIKKSNFKLLRQLKTAGFPYKMQAFHFRLIQLITPLMVAILIFILYFIRNQLNGYTDTFPIFAFILIILIAYISPYLTLRYFAYKRREVLTGEIVKFSHRLVVCITDKIPLYYAIRRAGRTCKVLRPYVDELLIDWMDNPRSAINNFGEQVGINEVLPLTNTLLASWNAPQDKIIDLFHQQIRNIDTMRDYQIKKKIEASPLRVTFVILIPFLVAGALVVLPWYKSFIEMLNLNF